MLSSVIVLVKSFAHHHFPTPGYMSVRLIHDHILNDTLCRQWMPSLFNNGISMMCSMMPLVVNLCDICERNSELPAQQVTEVEYLDSMILLYLVCKSLNFLCCCFPFIVATSQPLFRVSICQCSSHSRWPGPSLISLCPSRLQLRILASGFPHGLLFTFHICMSST